MSTARDAAKEAERPFRLTTPLGKDTLIATGISGTEWISRPYQLRIEVVSKNLDVKPADLLGKPVGFESVMNAGRHFHGRVKSVAPGTMADRQFRRYTIEIVPWFWFLRLTSDCRIFQKKSVKDIVQTVLSESGFSDYDLGGLKGQLATKPREYCVQYRESDFAFVSRLLEEVGAHYHFEHKAGSHKMVVGDSNDCFADVADPNKTLTGSAREFLGLQSFSSVGAYAPTKWVHTDYNYETPSQSLEANAATVADLPASPVYEIFDYPGLYPQKGDGTAYAKLRIEQEEAAQGSAYGSGSAPDLYAGGAFSIDGDMAGAKGRKWVVNSIEHMGQDLSLFAKSGGGSSTTYSNNFTAVSKAVPFRPPRVTPRPVISGVQTAVVVGPAGEEIHTDKMGRVYVQFHWDRYGDRKGSTSCWVRVAQPWAGKNWGTVYIPRIGDEVVVSFIEGNPDRPIVTGSVYNAERMPPYNLPGEKTKTGIRSRSSLGGGGSDFNELTFDDKKGSEQVYFHAQKDMERKVENNEKIDVDNDQTITIGNNQSLEVEKGNRKIKVSKGNQSTEISMGNHDTEIKMGNMSIKLGMGNMTTKLDLGKQETEAMQSIEMKVGANSIKIDQTGVTIKGIMIKIEGTAMVQTKGPMVESKADALHIVKGGIVMIN
ncbi:type VI secretion system Vgr family protein [Zavarzinia compransoris]|uniref:Type VI secretion system tip protein VgrG n=1 Tax=Zavarzinia compransoris TaxID=1264899 RepID=A0A317E7V4_9PROT|nr:type VI secretion system tip protein TssI/VgrG [Zavarzinia compransoris]PWR22336.1 type VI secretion system tip protein VgrG [Zavarzinia compransoris]TDP46898.1 type VI secretion system secreted protein VgrG [Zavarzinia compransoris]